MHNYQRKAIASGLVAAVAFVFIAIGIHDLLNPGEPGLARVLMRTLGIAGLFIAPVALVSCFNQMRILREVRAMRSGQAAIARWMVPPDECARYREMDQRLADRGEHSLPALPEHIPADGVEVIFSDVAVLVGDRHFELMTGGKTRIRNVRYIASNPPMIEFGLVIRDASKVYNVQTHSHVRTPSLWGTLRVPVASHAALQGETLAQHFTNR